LKTALFRAVVICEWILISLFVLVLIMSALDLPSAWHAQPCSVKITPNCYPWGWTEGPIGGPSWSYATKRNYLVSGFFMLGTAAIGLSSMFWLARGRRILVLLAVIALGTPVNIFCHSLSNSRLRT
jgi:hypothetical protein